MKTNLYTSAFVLALIFAGVVPALAGTVLVIPPEAPPYLINPSATGIDVLEAFIVTPGVTFDSTTAGFVNLDNGWSAMIVNPTYAVEYGPLSSSLTENLDIIGGSFTVNVYGFAGCASQFRATPPVLACSAANLIDAYQVTVNDGGYGGWTPTLTGGNLVLQNSDAAPEPASMLLICSGLIGLAVRRYHQR